MAYYEGADLRVKIAGGHTLPIFEGGKRVGLEAIYSGPHDIPNLDDCDFVLVEWGTNNDMLHLQYAEAESD